MFRSLLVASFVTLGSFLAIGCAPTNGVDDVEASQDDESALSLSVQVVNVSKSNAPAGLTIIKKKADYIAFFGQQPPSSLSFNQSWVLHYSMGVQGTGGHAAGIAAVERTGAGSDAMLSIHATDTNPGPNCIVTQALTNPQITVKIPKQKNSIFINQINDEIITDCGTIQGWCDSSPCEAGMKCDEFQDACVAPDFCPKVKCANGYVCDEDVDACVGRPCDVEDSNSCPSGFVCENQIMCITTPCPADFRCEPAPAVTCDQIGWEGICQGPTLKYCNGDEMVEQSCAPGQCEWVEASAYYDCVN